MVLAVAAIFAVGFIVFVVVGHQVIQGEPVVGGNEVDRRGGATPVVLVQVRRAGEARGELAEGGVLAAPKVTHGVAVLAVPLAPQGREVTDLVAAFAHIPRFSDEFDLAHHRVLLNQVEEGGQTVHV